MSRSILVIEDDNDLMEYLREMLSSHRYKVFTATNGSKARNLFFKINPDLVLLDLGLPDIQGESLLKEFKEDRKDVQIIILTANNEPSSIANNLKSGADDYIAKPFTFDELMARIHARLRDRKQDGDILKVADLELNSQTIEVKQDGKLIDLSQTEFELLKYLLENKNKVVTRDMILSHVWSSDAQIETRVVDVYIGYLRKKIDRERKEKLIHSKRGYGYIIKE